MITEHIFVNGEGYWWPKADGADGGQSCWLGLSGTAHIPEETAKFAKERRVLVQAGGNCGYYIRKYAELFGMVYTFEPDPINFHCLVQNVPNFNVIKTQACLGAEHVPVSLNNVLTDVGATHVSGPGAIPTLRIDDLGLEVCDMIALDIEGYELFALKGARETIERTRPVIVIEYYEPWAQRQGWIIPELNEYLAGLGYYWFADIPNSQGDKVYMYRE